MYFRCYFPFNLPDKNRLTPFVYVRNLLFFFLIAFFILRRVNKSLNPFHATFQKVLNPSFSTIPLLLRQHKSPYLFASHCFDCHCFVTKLSLPQISLYSQNASLMIEWNQRIMGNKFQVVHPCPHLHHPKQFCYFFVIFVNIIIWCVQFFTFCNPNSL